MNLDLVTKKEEPIRLANGLLWWKNEGRGFYPVTQKGQYDQAYFDKYVKYSQSPMGISLNVRRFELVQKYAPNGIVVDIGIGCGQFIQLRGFSNTFGYDVNPTGIRWLLDRGLWWDPYAHDPETVTCWDSLEHMRRPHDFLKCVRRFAFLSIPIFKDADHVLRSKHFRPDEHFFYFTRDGLLAWMKDQDFSLVEENRMETELGREDIGTFVFVRKNAVYIV